MTRTPECVTGDNNKALGDSWIGILLGKLTVKQINTQFYRILNAHVHLNLTL